MPPELAAIPSPARGADGVQPQPPAAQALNEELIRLADTRTGSADAIRELLCLGAQVNYQDEYGKTALHYLFSHCHFQVDSKLEILLARGARVDVQDTDGNTPLHLYLLKENDICGEDVLSEDVDGVLRLYDQTIVWEEVEKLLKKGFDVSLRNQAGQTLYELASACRQASASALPYSMFMVIQLGRPHALWTKHLFEAIDDNSSRRVQALMDEGYFANTSYPTVPEENLPVDLADQTGCAVFCAFFKCHSVGPREAWYNMRAIDYARAQGREAIAQILIEHLPAWCVQEYVQAGAPQP